MSSDWISGSMRDHMSLVRPSPVPDTFTRDNGKDPTISDFMQTVLDVDLLIWIFLLGPRTRVRPIADDPRRATFRMLASPMMYACFSKGNVAYRPQRRSALRLRNTLKPLRFGGSGYETMCSVFLST